MCVGAREKDSRRACGSQQPASLPPPQLSNGPAWNASRCSQGRNGGTGTGVGMGGGVGRGVLVYPVLCSLLTGLQPFILTAGVSCALLGAQNLTALFLRTIRSLTPFCEASFCLGCNTTQARDVNGCLPGAALVQWRVALASVRQGVVSSHFAGRFRFGEHDGAGMERRALRWGAAVCASPWQP